MFRRTMMQVLNKALILTVISFFMMKAWAQDIHAPFPVPVSATSTNAVTSTVPPAATDTSLLPSFFQSTTNFPSTMRIDDREWKLKASSSVGMAEVAMYAPTDGSTNQLGEQIVIKKINVPISNQIDPAKFSQNILGPFQILGFKETRTVIESSPQEAIVAVRTQVPGGVQTEDLQRIAILPDKKGMLIIQYSINKNDMGTEWRNKWIKILKNIAPFESTQ